MVSLVVLFWLFVIFFAIIGAMRGWAKELMVVFSIILALFLIILLEQYIPVLRLKDSKMEPETRFFIRAIILSVSAFFGYQAPNIKIIAGPRFHRERLQDGLLGILIGAFNGYLLVGTLWFFMNDAQYPFKGLISAPGSDPLGQAALAMVKHMAPVYLVVPWIYFAVGVAFLFVLVVFI